MTPPDPSADGSVVPPRGYGMSPPAGVPARPRPSVGSPPVNRSANRSAPAQTARKLLVSLHVVTSLGWMGQALALFTLMVYGHRSGERRSAYEMASVIDEHLLASLCNASAFTGIMLAALTPWGFFRHWWVLVKFAITLTQLYSGIFVLSPNLAASTDAAVQGRDRPAGALVAGSLLMASAIAFQAWVSLAKPWRRTPWAARPGRPKVLPSGPTWLYWFALGVPVVDYALGAAVGAQPMPLFELLTVLVYPIWRYLGLHSGHRRPTRCDEAHVEGESTKTGVRQG